MIAMGTGLSGRGRSPHGERGLKYHRRLSTGEHLQSLSSWRAWIEIRIGVVCFPWRVVALLMESVD